MPKLRSGLRFRRLETAVWANSGVRSLPLKGKFLYLYLRTGPHTTSIPGFYAVGQRELAEKLQWSLAVLHKTFSELQGRGLAEADWLSGVVHIPGVIEVDPPANPDVIRSWRHSWADIPECALKTAFHGIVWRHCQQRGESFQSAAEEVVGPPDP